MERGRILAEIDGDLWVVADTNHHLPDCGKADARRIVACVNACAGIDTDALEQYGDGNLEALFKMQSERDELLSALEEITADYKDMLDCDYGREYNHITEKCDKLIDRVKEIK